jgi:hypothetical protein
VTQTQRRRGRKVRLQLQAAPEDVFSDVVWAVCDREGNVIQEKEKGKRSSGSNGKGMERREVEDMDGIGIDLGK